MSGPDERPGTDYLWDGSGPADPEVARLEEALRSFRHVEEAPPDWTSLAPAVLTAPTPPRRPAGGRRLFVRLALAAVLTLAVAGLSYVGYYMIRPPRPWQVIATSGSPAIGGEAIERTGLLRAGQALTTDAGSSAQISQSDVGEVEVGPGSELHLVEAGKREQRLALRHGKLRAMIWAPPKLFQVDTPAARAIDLGCAYTLEVRRGGAGELAVESGWVALEANGVEAFVPAGARARISREVGPGVPLWNDAPEALRTAIWAYEDERSQAEASGVGGLKGLDDILGAARPRDALTLWHLLARGGSGEREILFDALAEAAPPPRGVTREGILRGDREQLDDWWNALGLGSTSWWRLWRAPLR